MTREEQLGVVVDTWAELLNQITAVEDKASAVCTTWQLRIQVCDLC